MLLMKARAYFLILEEKTGSFSHGFLTAHVCKEHSSEIWTWKDKSVSGQVLEGAIISKVSVTWTQTLSKKK